MPLRKTEGFVLRTYSLREADKICVFLTRDAGKLRGVAYGARKMKSRFGSSLEPFTQVALTYFEKEGRELVSLSSCDIVRSHFERASRDAGAAAGFSYMAELLSEFLPEHEPNEKVYRLVVATLEAIEEGDDLLPSLRYFETWVLKLSGFYPDVHRCAGCGGPAGKEVGVYLGGEGAVRCEECSGGRGVYVSTGLRGTITRILRSHPAEFARERADVRILEQLGEVNYSIIRNSLERDLRSHRLMKELRG